MRPYRPSNGTEGESFYECWCARCEKDVNEDCPILTATFLYNPPDPEYPKEWIWNEQGKPECTAFQERNRDPP